MFFPLVSEPPVSLVLETANLLMMAEGILDLMKTVLGVNDDFQIRFDEEVVRATDLLNMENYLPYRIKRPGSGHWGQMS